MLYMCTKMISYSYHSTFYLSYIPTLMIRSLSFLIVLLLSIFSFAPTTFAQEDEALIDMLEQLANNDSVDDEQAPEEPTAAEEHDAASDILDDMEDDKWSWAGDEAIEAVDIEETSVVIKTTQIMYDGKAVSKYKVYYSDRTLATFQDYDKIQDVVVSPMKTQDGMVHLMVDVLSPEQTYYVVVAPVHPTDPTIEPLTMISDEVSFTTKKKAVSGSAKVFNNVSYTYTDGSVALTWTPSNDAVNTEVHLRHQSEGAYTKIGSPAMQDGKFNFSVDKSGNYFLKMIALNADGQAIGKEHIQTVKIEEVEAPAQPVEKAPQVGPATDMIIGLLAFAFVMYFVYRFRKIEN